jgi:CBS domain-containing protein
MQYLGNEADLMKRHAPRLVALATIAVAVCLLYSTASRAQGSDLAIVVNDKNPVSNLTLTELRRLFAGERRSWDGKKDILIMVPAPKTPERSTMLRVIYLMGEMQYREFWLGRMFRGEASAEPLVVASSQLMNDGVASIPHAVACLPALNVRGRGVKVLKIDGHLPGEIGYPLR